MEQGHDVVAMASPERYVVGLDISESALEKAAEVNHILTMLLSSSITEFFINYLWITYRLTAPHRRPSTLRS